jgi:hypothetical protein
MTARLAFATCQHALEALDDWSADHPLEALREYAECLSPSRLDACATAEPAAALIHADRLLTPERRAWCAKAAQQSALQRFVPDRLVLERRIVIARARGGDP